MEIVTLEIGPEVRRAHTTVDSPGVVNPPPRGILWEPVVGARASCSVPSFSLGVSTFEPGATSPRSALPEGVSGVYFVLDGMFLWRCGTEVFCVRRHQGVAVRNATPHQLTNISGQSSQIVCMFSSRSAEPPWFETSTPDASKSATDVLYGMSPSPSTVNLNAMSGTHFPAGRWGRSIANGMSQIQGIGFSAGLSILMQYGSQVPWHHHPDGQHEVYFVPYGRVQMCIGSECRRVLGPSAIIIPGDSWHQITNLSDHEVPLLYCFEGDIAAPHWRQELMLNGNRLPAAGAGGVPPLPEDAFPQCTSANAEDWFTLVGKRKVGQW